VAYHIVLIACIFALTLGWWRLIHSTPGTLGRLLSHRFLFIFGASYFFIGIFCAFYAAYGMKEPQVMLRCLVSGYVGLWFMLSPSSGARGSEDDEQMLRRLVLMLALLFTLMIASVHVYDQQVMALLNLLLVTGGFWVLTNYLWSVDHRYERPPARRSRTRRFW
jgi:hypothetical protein